MTYEVDGGVNLVEYRRESDGFSPDLPPWGPIERQKDVDICAAIFRDAVNEETAKEDGHRHNKLYNGYGDDTVIESPVGIRNLYYKSDVETHQDRDGNFFRRYERFLIANNADTETAYFAYNSIARVITNDGSIAGLLRFEFASGVVTILEDYMDAISISDSPGKLCILSHLVFGFHSFYFLNRTGDAIVLIVETIGSDPNA